MSPRNTVLAVAVLGLLVGITVGLLASGPMKMPASPLPDDEEPELGSNVLVFRPDLGLDAAATVTVAGDVQTGRRWVFAFRDPDLAHRAYEAARDAATKEHRRALDWP